jgi:hypothetical protein
MGKLSIFLVLALAVTFGSYSLTVNRRTNSSVENYVSYNSKTVARNINNSILEVGLKRLADSSSWRAGYSNLSFAGGTAWLSVRDTTYGGKTAIALRCVSVCNTDTQISKVIVAQKLMPPVVHAAFTAFGPLDATVSDMYIDGQDHSDVIVAAGPPVQYQLLPNAGFYGISTGAPTYVNVQDGIIGGTDRTVTPWTDIAPAFPNSPKVIETSSSWPNGFPKTPDAAMGLPEGTLKAIAKSGANGGRYLTTEHELDSLATGKFPLDGVTYIDVSPLDTLWDYSHNNMIPDNSGGILVFHCDTKTAYWDRIEFPTPGMTFKGMLIFDKFFHIHINVLGAVVMLTPNTITAENCPLNKDKTIALSSTIIAKYTQNIIPKIGGGWRNKLQLRSWYEQ